MVFDDLKNALSRAMMDLKPATIPDDPPQFEMVTLDKSEQDNHKWLSYVAAALNSAKTFEIHCKPFYNAQKVRRQACGLLLCNYETVGTGGAGGALLNRKTRLTKKIRYRAHSTSTAIRIPFSPDESCFCLRAITSAAKAATNVISTNAENTGCRIISKKLFPIVLLPPHKNWRSS